MCRNLCIAFLGAMNADSDSDANGKIIRYAVDSGDGTQLADSLPFVGTNAHGRYGFKSSAHSLA